MTGGAAIKFEYPAEYGAHVAGPALELRPARLGRGGRIVAGITEQGGAVGILPWFGDGQPAPLTGDSLGIVLAPAHRDTQPL